MSKKKNDVWILIINLQVGLFISFQNNQVIGCYQNHRKEMVILIPWSAADFNFPPAFNDYKKIVGKTDLLTVGVFWNDKFVDITEIDKE